MNITLDIAAVLSAIIWPVTILVTLWIYRTKIPMLIGGLAGRVKKLEFAGMPLELAAAKPFAPAWWSGTPSAVDLRHKATAVQIIDSTARNSLTQRVRRDWLRGERRPQLDELLAMARMANASLDELFEIRTTPLSGNDQEVQTFAELIYGRAAAWADFAIKGNFYICRDPYRISPRRRAVRRGLRRHCREAVTIRNALNCCLLASHDTIRRGRLLTWNHYLPENSLVIPRPRRKKWKALRWITAI